MTTNSHSYQDFFQETTKEDSSIINDFTLNWIKALISLPQSYRTTKAPLRAVKCLTQERLNSHSYLHFLQYIFEEISTNVALATLWKLKWFQRDGSDTYNAQTTIIWLALAPCLNPFDHYLWGAVCERVFDKRTQT